MLEVRAPLSHYNSGVGLFLLRLFRGVLQTEIPKDYRLVMLLSGNDRLKKSQARRSSFAREIWWFSPSMEVRPVLPCSTSFPPSSGTLRRQTRKTRVIRRRTDTSRKRSIWRINGRADYAFPYILNTIVCYQFKIISTIFEIYELSILVMKK